MLIGKFEAANFFQLSLRNYSIFPSFEGGGGRQRTHIKVKCKRKDNKLFSVIGGTQLDSRLDWARLLLLPFYCVLILRA